MCVFVDDVMRITTPSLQRACQSENEAICVHFGIYGLFLRAKMAIILFYPCQNGYLFASIVQPSVFFTLHYLRFILNSSLCYVRTS